MERAVLKRRMATGPFQGLLPLDAYLLTDLPILRLDVDVHFMAVSDLQHYARHVGLGVWELMRSRAFEPYGAAWDGRQTVFFLPTHCFSARYPVSGILARMFTALSKPEPSNYNIEAFDGWI